MSRFKFLPKSKTSQLPKTAGVYAFKNKGELLYIGKAANIKNRVKNHFQQPSFRDNLFLKRVKKIGYIKTDSEIGALLLEAKLVKKHQPKFNVIWRDDKNYFYVGISKEGFPRIFITHQKLKTTNHKLQTEYVGPFVDGRALKQALRTLRKVFPYRSCRNLPKRPCLWYQLARCPAPCLLKTNLGSQLSAFQKKIKKECKINAKNLVRVIRGKKKQVLKDLEKEMKGAAKKEDFEIAAKIRNQIFSLEKVLAHSKIFVSPPPQEILIKWVETEKKLKKILRIHPIKNKISRIEAYDVSNIQGQQATGSMVTFIKGVPDKSFYRKFKIKHANAPMRIDKPNDIAMIKEVLKRRFKHTEWPYPDLILIDGGKAQLNAAINTKCQNSNVKSIKILSLAKKENKLYIEGRRKPALLKKLPREIFNLILQLRDEAHRFARVYHHKLREIDLQFKT
jgi:excinuclease ABC subunit C